jgi:hypothetical protein
MEPLHHRYSSRPPSHAFTPTHPPKKPSGNYGSYEGRCVICGGAGVSDAYYCRECCQEERVRTRTISMDCRSCVVDARAIRWKGYMVD